MTRPLIQFAIAGALAITLHATEYHVALSGTDANSGTSAAPFRSIQHAADLAQPGDVITIHAGLYRERIHPPRGGQSDARRIVYRAAPGEKVEIKGSEVVTNWVKVQGEVWKATLPNSFFGSFNPYSDLIHGDWFISKGRPHHTGAVYLNGAWLAEAAKLDDVLGTEGTPPSSLSQGNGDYLLNVAWLRPGTGPGDAGRMAATGFAAHHGTQNAPCSEGGECIGFITHGDWVRYEGVDFHQRTEQIEFRAASATEGGIIEVRLDGPDGERLGSCVVSNTGGWQSWSAFKARLKPVSGVRTICLVFRSLRPVESNYQWWFARVDASDTTIWAQFKGVNPNEQLVEINVRRTVFYPEKTGINYITVRGLHLSQAATPWAPPTAEQIGLIGTHWSKGWIIESNVISHSTCCGIALGKYGDEWDNRAGTAEGYVGTLERALTNGWNRDTIGHHLVRNNEISHCEQTGIVGSLGAAFSTITGNNIHDIHVRQLFSGAEMAGIKFHGAIDVQIVRNHIHHCCGGVWLDWMAQGARVSRNLIHDNLSYDLFFEVDHGPILVDNNLLLSGRSLWNVSHGVAFVHNLFGGSVGINAYDARQTPFHQPHSTALAGLHDNPRGDDRYYNNIFAGPADLRQYDDARMPVWMDGNIFLDGARPSKFETAPLVLPQFDPALKLIEKANGCRLAIQYDPAWTAGRTRQLVTTKLLGRALVPDAAYEQPNGRPISINTDYFGRRRNTSNPAPGPFENPIQGQLNLKVW